MPLTIDNADGQHTLVQSPGLGRLRGRRAAGITAFLGIPYAASPVGPLRLQPPQPAPRWSGTLDATRYGATPPKPPYYAPFDAIIPEPLIEGDGYLNLNVWTPGPDTSGLPVMVWMHGGNFMNGSGAVPTYDGSSFARRGVVLVTLNYRLGAEGFLYFDDGVANLGLLDQIAALEWVAENIASFGGDPANVTLFGQSAGGQSAVLLLTAPRCRGLFRRVIAQSGSGNKTNDPVAALRLARRLAEIVGARPVRDEIAAVDQARLLDAQLQVAGEIRRASLDERRDWGDLALSNIPFNPTVDGAVLPLPTLDAAGAGAGATVDLLVGTNTDEARLAMVPTGLIDTISDEGLGLEADLYGLHAASVDRYRRARPGASAGEVLAAIRTDLLHRMPAVRLAERRESTEAHTWMYEFAWRSPAFGGRLGACHLLDVPFVFDTLATGEMDTMLGAHPPQALADQMCASWVQFAATGDPGWPRYTGAHRSVMTFDAEFGVCDDPRSEERLLWEAGGVR